MEQEKPSEQLEQAEENFTIQSDIAFSGASGFSLVLVGFMDDKGYFFAFTLVCFLALLFLCGTWRKIVESSWHRHIYLMAFFVNGLGALVAVLMKSIWPIFIFLAISKFLEAVIDE